MWVWDDDLRSAEQWEKGQNSFQAPSDLQKTQNKKPHLLRGRAFLINFGDDLLSHTVSHAVSSAQ